MLRRQTQARCHHAAIRAEMRALRLTRHVPFLPLAGAILGLINALALITMLSAL